MQKPSSGSSCSKCRSGVRSSKVAAIDASGKVLKVKVEPAAGSGAVEQLDRYRTALDRAQAVRALRSGGPRAQGGWVKGSCLVREGVPTDRRHAVLTQRTTHRLRGTEDER